ncbi:MAG: hypothetical protein HYS13_04400 [Planctomycetia bacterium]|nr:hypothetical protein [Planctomycetia bacterium]
MSSARPVPTEQPVEEQFAKARAELPALERLPLEQLRTRLQGENYTASELQAIAAEIGIRPRQRTSREELIEQIATKIANYRGYQLLMGEALTDTGAPQSGQTVP